ncbi:Transcription factor LHW [Ananas comosus]|nr:Transcription factor LHW [Ananas comosus]
MFSLREVLRRLCAEIGWSYAVFWRAIGPSHRMLLVWEDGCCGHTSGILGSEASDLLLEEHGLVQKLHNQQAAKYGSQTEESVNALVRKTMMTQVHVIGDGIVGEAAFTGNHRWIVRDSLKDYGSLSKDADEMNQQFAAGIQTIVIIPILPRGVLQLGSTQMLMENVGFLIHTKNLLSQLNNRSGSSFSRLSLDTNPSFVEPILHCSRQLEGETVGARVYTKANLSLGKQGVTNDNGSKIQTQPSVMDSDFTSRLTSLEEQLLFMSHDGLLEPGNNAGSAVQGTGAVRLILNGRDNPNLLEDSNIVSPHLQNKLLNTVDSLGKFGSLLHGSNEITRVLCANSSGTGTSQMIDQRYNNAESSQQNQPSSPYRVTQAVPIEGNEGRHENDLVEAAGLRRSIQNDRQTRSIANSIANESNKIYATENGNGVKDENDCKLSHIRTEKTSLLPLDRSMESDLFDMLGPKFRQFHDGSDNSLGINAFIHSIKSDASPAFDSANDDFSQSGIFSVADTDQLLDAIVSSINPTAKQNSDDSISCKTSQTDIHNSACYGGYAPSSEVKQDELSYLPPVPIKNETAISSYVKPQCSHPQSTGVHKSQIHLWLESGQNMKCDSMPASNSKKLDITGKANRKRSRPGESPRPRPKDRQMIQDRIKELREIVPNGAKCSIDALLEKTIKHMLFLQSVTKYADKLKEKGECKIVDKDGGLLLKDCYEGGATWAFDVGSQSMICPIIVEDLNQPRQMLVEMLCEERGFFLEIADFVKGLGLTILKGVMEARKSKVWARFVVEANRDVTRMEIFLSLVRLLEQTAGGGIIPMNVNNVDATHTLLCQPSSIPATGL